jgi:hypothetical protein
MRPWHEVRAGDSTTAAREAALKAITKRLRRLEHQFGPADGEPPFVMAVAPAGWTMGIDLGRCVEILREMGMLSAGRSALLDLSHVPYGLNADATEKCVREHAAEVCGEARTGAAV